MKIQTIHIVSSNICYGPPPSDTDEVEQHLTIEASGKIWFTGYNYGDGIGMHQVGRTAQFTKRRNTINNILELFKEYMMSDNVNEVVQDVGSWNMNITDEDGTVYRFDGALTRGVCVGNVDLTRYLKKYIPVDGLMVFGESKFDFNFRF